LFTESARCLDQSFLISTDGEIQRSRHHDPSARAAHGDDLARADLSRCQRGP
jgi:hypothetical protein